MREAVERFLADGMTVALSCSLEPMVPFAAGHEIIRQGRRELDLVAPISDSLF
ncbi:MAG: CoA transferase subunit A, partial [Chloroflexi bacterium]